VGGREGEAELDEAVTLRRAVLAVNDDLDRLDGAVHLEELSELHLVDGRRDVVDHEVADHLGLRRLARRALLLGLCLRLLLGLLGAWLLLLVLLVLLHLLLLLLLLVLVLVVLMLLLGHSLVLLLRGLLLHRRE
jgi:hypothetical protein